MGPIHISQPPGEKNALGRLRFNFPNKFLVYQHDTPNKSLFALDRRAFSHGCMRVQDPVKYAEVLLSLVRPHDGYTEDRIRKMFGSSEVDIQFPTFVPVHLTYQTAFVDEQGKLEFREDIYGRDKTLLAILKGDERKVADIPRSSAGRTRFAARRWRCRTITAGRISSPASSVRSASRSRRRCRPRASARPKAERSSGKRRALWARRNAAIGVCCGPICARPA